MPRSRHFRIEYKFPDDFWRSALASVLSVVTVWLAYGIGATIIQRAVFELFPDQDDNIWVLMGAIVLSVFGGAAISVYTRRPVERWWKRRLRLEPSRESQS